MNAELLAIASRNIEKAKKCASKFKIQSYYGSYEEMIQNDKIDAVYIPLPNHLHSYWAKKAIENGKHVLIEKPIATSEGELHSLYKFAESHNRVVMEALIIPFNDRLQKIKDLIHSGIVGDVRYLFSDFSITLDDPYNVRFLDKPGAGALSDLGTYNIGMSNLILDDYPVEVYANLIKKSKTKYVDMAYNCMMKYSSEVVSIFTGGFNRDYNMELKVVGSNGKIYVKDFLSNDKKLLLYIYKNNKKKIIELKHLDHYQNEVENFCNRTLYNKTLIWNKEQTIKHRILIDKLMKSASKRKVCKV